MEVLLFFIIFLKNVNTYNILVYSPAYGSSHSKFMGRLADTLTDAGHRVTVLVPVVDISRRNDVGVKTTRDIVYVDQDEIALKQIVSAKSSMASYWLYDYKAEDYHNSFSYFHNNLVASCANLFRNSEVFEEMKARNFDVVLSEPLSICGLGYAYKLGVRKMIQASSCTLYEYMNSIIGEPDEFTYVPSVLGQTDDQMNFMERYENFKTTHYMRERISKAFDNEEKCFQTGNFSYIPSWKELLTSSSMYFTNGNPYLDFPRATIQKTVLVGGISVDMEHIRKQKINEDWDKVLNMRSRIMLISFGSMVRSKDMPKEYRETLLRAIQSFSDVTFIWKYESNDTHWAHHVKNIHFSQWVPQTALLNDQRVTAFLTHGGLGSVNELAYTGKPAVMIPIFWDQARNGQMYSRLGAAIALKKHDLRNYKLLRKSIESILYDETYTKNAQRIAEMLENQPVKPADLVVKNTEFVAKFGPFPKMEPSVRRLNFVQRSGLDVLITFYSRPVFAVLFIILVLKFVFSNVNVSIRRKKQK